MVLQTGMPSVTRTATRYEVSMETLLKSIFFSPNVESVWKQKRPKRHGQRHVALCVS